MDEPEAHAVRHIITVLRVCRLAAVCMQSDSTRSPAQAAELVKGTSGEVLLQGPRHIPRRIREPCIATTYRPLPAREDGSFRMVHWMWKREGGFHSHCWQQSLQCRWFGSCTMTSKLPRITVLYFHVERADSAGGIRQMQGWKFLAYSFSAVQFREQGFLQLAARSQTKGATDVRP